MTSWGAVPPISEQRYQYPGNQNSGHEYKPEYQNLEYQGTSTNEVTRLGQDEIRAKLDRPLSHLIRNTIHKNNTIP